VVKNYNRKIELFDDKIGFVEYVSHMGTDLTIVNSARVSFGKQVEELHDRDKKLIKYLIKHGHTSTLEHNVVTLRFMVPLFIRSQHHRHRTWSYNEISRRYTDFNLEFYEPHQFRKQSESNRQASTNSLFDPLIKIGHSIEGTSASYLVSKHNKQSVTLYDKLIKHGICREQARGVLPQNLYTEYYGTCNLNNLFKFIRLRTHSGAQWEIQKVAKACLTIAEDLFPVSVAAHKEVVVEEKR
jgi:thymidylate synthase (FAD)